MFATPWACFKRLAAVVVSLLSSVILFLLFSATWQQTYIFPPSSLLFCRCPVDFARQEPCQQDLFRPPSFPPSLSCVTLLPWALKFPSSPRLTLSVPRSVNPYQFLTPPDTRLAQVSRQSLFGSLVYFVKRAVREHCQLSPPPLIWQHLLPSTSRRYPPRSLPPNVIPPSLTPLFFQNQIVFALLAFERTILEYFV